MYITFIEGLTVGILFGIVFHHWWIRPDIKELQSHLRAKDDQIDRLVRSAMKRFHEDDA